MNLTPAGAHLLDTSAIILLMQQRLTASPEALVPFAALGELNIGVFRVVDYERELSRMRRAIHSAEVLQSTEETALHFGRITAHLRRIGQMIPINDVWVAAQAIEINVPLLSDDAHFRRVPGLRFIPVR